MKRNRRKSPPPKKRTYSGFFESFIAGLKPVFVLTGYIVYFGVMLFVCNLAHGSHIGQESCHSICKTLYSGSYVAAAILFIAILLFVSNCCSEALGEFFTNIWNLVSSFDMGALTTRVASILEKDHLQRQLKAAGASGHIGSLRRCCHEESSSDDDDDNDDSSDMHTFIPSRSIAPPYCKHRVIYYANQTATRFYVSPARSLVTDAPEIPHGSPSKTTNTSDESASPNDSDESYSPRFSSGSESLLVSTGSDCPTTTPESGPSNISVEPSCSDTSGLSSVASPNSDSNATSDNNVSLGDSENSSKLPVNVTTSNDAVRSTDPNIPLVSATSGIPVVFTTRAPNSYASPGWPVANSLSTNFPGTSRSDEFPDKIPTTSGCTEVPTVSATSGIPVVFKLGSAIPLTTAAWDYKDVQKGGKTKSMNKPVGVVKPNSKRQHRRGNRQGQPKRYIFVRCCCAHAQREEEREMKEYEEFITYINGEEAIKDTTGTFIEMQRRMLNLVTEARYLANEAERKRPPPYDYFTCTNFESDDSDVSIDEDEGEAFERWTKRYRDAL